MYERPRGLNTTVTMSWKKSEKLMETIRHYANFPATGVSLRQMVQFGEKPSTGMQPALHLAVAGRIDKIMR